VRLSRAAECSVIGPRGSSEPWVVIARNVPLTAEGQQPLLCARRHPSGTGRFAPPAHTVPKWRGFGSARYARSGWAPAGAEQGRLPLGRQGHVPRDPCILPTVLQSKSWECGVETGQTVGSWPMRPWDSWVVPSCLSRARTVAWAVEPASTRRGQCQARHQERL
jgi:hypothetical protein